MSGRGNATLEELTRLAQADPASAGRVIKSANSASLGRPTASIEEAIRRLGAEGARSACAAFAIVDKLPGGSCIAFDYGRFWSQSFARAVASRELASRFDVVAADEAFACGLIARTGELALATVYPAECEKLLAKSPECNDIVERLSAENSQYGITSVQLSAALLSDWRLPALFVDAVLEVNTQSEVPPGARPRHGKLAELLKLADSIAALCIKNAESIVPPSPALFSSLERLQIDGNGLGRICDLVTSELATWRNLIEAPHLSANTVVQNSARNGLLPTNTDRRLAGLTILVAEDNDAQRKLISRVLQSAGHTVIASDNGETALRLALEKQPDLVIADWQMPGMDGLELCAALRRTKFGHGVYFILVTGDADERVLIQAFERGVDDFVTKPLLPRAFQARMMAAQRLIQVETEIRNERAELRRLTAELGIANRKLELASLTDSLTDLPNRRFLMQQIETQWSAAVRKNRRLSCLLIDADHFKSINDRYGHALGDAVLKELASTFRGHKRDEDIACRYGGEEFAVILPETDSCVAYQVAERLRCAVEREIESRLPVLKHPITISVGLASRTSQIACATELLDCADQALYYAKREGRNRTCIFGSQDELRSMNVAETVQQAALS